jgi:hypothetical protein
VHSLLAYPKERGDLSQAKLVDFSVRGSYTSELEVKLGIRRSCSCLSSSSRRIDSEAMTLRLTPRSSAASTRRIGMTHLERPNT